MNRVGVGREREGEWNRVGVAREAGQMGWREGGQEGGREGGRMGGRAGRREGGIGLEYGGRGRKSGIGLE